MTSVPLGPIVPEATRLRPAIEQHVGQVVTLEPLAAIQATELWEAAQSADMSWAYLRYGPFPTEGALAAHLERISGLEQQPFAVVPASSGKPEGWTSFCDIMPTEAAIEIGRSGFRLASNEPVQQLRRYFS